MQQLETGIFWGRLHWLVWWLMLAVIWDLNRSNSTSHLPRLGLLHSVATQDPSSKCPSQQRKSCIIFSIQTVKLSFRIPPATSKSQAHPDSRRGHRPPTLKGVMSRNLPSSIFDYHTYWPHPLKAIFLVLSSPSLHKSYMRTHTRTHTHTHTPYNPLHPGHSFHVFFFSEIFWYFLFWTK